MYSTRSCGERGEERGPAAVAVELLVAAEQLRAAGAARVDALGVVVPVLAGEGALGAGLAEHRVLLRGQPAAPLGVVDGHGVRCRRSCRGDLERDGGRPRWGGSCRACSCPAQPDSGTGRSRHADAQWSSGVTSGYACRVWWIQPVVTVVLGALLGAADLNAPEASGWLRVPALIAALILVRAGAARLRERRARARVMNLPAPDGSIGRRSTPRSACLCSGRRHPPGRLAAVGERGRSSTPSRRRRWRPGWWPARRCRGRQRGGDHGLVLAIWLGLATLNYPTAPGAAAAGCRSSRRSCCSSPPGAGCRSAPPEPAALSRGGRAGAVSAHPARVGVDVQHRDAEALPRHRRPVAVQRVLDRVRAGDDDDLVRAPSTAAVRASDRVPAVDDLPARLTSEGAQRLDGRLTSAAASAGAPSRARRARRPPRPPPGTPAG